MAPQLAASLRETRKPHEVSSAAVSPASVVASREFPPFAAGQPTTLVRQTAPFAAGQSGTLVFRTSPFSQAWWTGLVQVF